MTRFPLALVLSAVSSLTLAAQATTPPPPPAAPPPIGASRVDHLPMTSQNVRVEVTITDTFGTGPTRKSVSMLVNDQHMGRIRSSLSVGVLDNTGHPMYSSIGINVDATPEIRPDGRVFMILAVQYTPDQSMVVPGGPTGQKPAEVNESLSTVLLDGKPTVVSQSADPQSDRKVTLEVTATIVR